MTHHILKKRYEIQRTLGKRAGQQTLLALDRHTRDMVVVKVLTFGSDLTWETFKLFEREANTLQALDHPAIPRYCDYFELETSSGKGFALVQSYIDAPSLDEHIKAGRTFSETELKYIAKAALAILHYLHTRCPPLVHRDIKPGNILLTPRAEHQEGQLYIVDFGAVRAVAQEGGTITVVGTYGYMPPEQFGGRAVPASDLYALGATLIYVAAGQHPADLPQKDLRICFEEHANLSPAFTDWLRWMTEPRLEHRFASASDALHALKQQAVRKSLSLVPTKPPDSKVVLTKTHHFLEIIIPLKRFSIDLLLLIGFATAWNGILLIWFSSAFHSFFSGGWLAALILLLPLAAGLWLTLLILFTLFGYIQLQIDQEEISLTYHLFGVKYDRPRPCSRHHITRIERTQAYYTKDTDGDLVEEKPQINILADTKNFAIGGGMLSESEIDWLAHELSEWLGIPISQEK